MLSVSAAHRISSLTQFYINWSLWAMLCSCQPSVFLFDSTMFSRCPSCVGCAQLKYDFSVYYIFSPACDSVRNYFCSVGPRPRAPSCCFYEHRPWFIITKWGFVRQVFFFQLVISCIEIFYTCRSYLTWKIPFWSTGFYFLFLCHILYFLFFYFLCCYLSFRIVVWSSLLSCCTFHYQLFFQTCLCCPYNLIYMTRKIIYIIILGLVF